MSSAFIPSGSGQVMEPEVESMTYHNNIIHKTLTPQIVSTSSPDMDKVQDLICVGFGPASLAIAIAFADQFPKSSNRPKVSFLERQTSFAWHSGMQIPGARMQISFLKDLATPRNPRSKFTFINYLFAKGRLNNFINLDTFTPSRREYEAYLCWCAGHFEKEGLVSYGQEVLEVVPQGVSRAGKVSSFKVVSKDAATGKLVVRVARHVVIAVGGKPMFPAEFPPTHPAVVHSSKYTSGVCNTLPDSTKAYSIAVVGNGQSAAEIFNELPSRFPNAKVTMIIKGSALRPSDDSPFVNEIFDPDRVDGIFEQNADIRMNALKLDKATNYGVVRIGLLEHLYDTLYQQRLVTDDQSKWPIRIINNRKVSGVTSLPGNRLRLQIQKQKEGADTQSVQEHMDVDAVFVSTGYVRNAHEDMLNNMRSLLPQQYQSSSTNFPVRRDYKVEFDARKVESGAGIWLQGCNEKTHGLSDTLLSIAAIRGGEMIQSIFSDVVAEESLRAKL